MLIRAASAKDRSLPLRLTTEQWTGWPSQSKTFTSMAGYDWDFDSLILPHASQVVSGLEVTRGYFKVIGIQPLLGRTFLNSEYSKPYSVSFIILGYDLWQHTFHGDPHIVGRKVHLRHRPPLTVVEVQPVVAFLNRQARPVLLPLLGAVALVFLIACGNVAGLLLARGLRRQQEYALRGALGASRIRLFRRVFAESLLLSVFGGAFGVALAVASVKGLKAIGTALAIVLGQLLRAFLFGVQPADPITLIGVVLLFGAVALLACYLPARRATKIAPMEALRYE